MWVLSSWRLIPSYDIARLFALLVLNQFQIGELKSVSIKFQQHQSIFVMVLFKEKII